MVSCALWHIPTPHSTTCPCCSSSIGDSSKATLHTLCLPVQYFHYHHCTPQSPFHYHITCCYCCLMPHLLCAAPLQTEWFPLLLIPSFYLIMTLIMTLSQTMRLIHSDSDYELLWIYDLLHLPDLFMVNPKGTTKGMTKEVTKGTTKGAAGGARSKPCTCTYSTSPSHNLTCLLHLIVPGFHTMMHGYHIGPYFTHLLQYPIECGLYSHRNTPKNSLQSEFQSRLLQSCGMKFPCNIGIAWKQGITLCRISLTVAGLFLIL